MRKFTLPACLLMFLICPAGHCGDLVWKSGFEQGFPGREWLDLPDDSYSSGGSMPKNRVSAWTIINRISGQPVYSGNHAYKGWITGASKSNHRAYPGIHANFPTPLVNTFMVYLDVDYGSMGRNDWIHLGTWGNHDPEAQNGKWALHTLAVRDKKLEFAHVIPFHGKYIGPGKRPNFPLNTWIRLTLYIHYKGSTGDVQLWQDGTPMLYAHVSELEHYPGTRLRTAHWGMYASGTINHGIQYNDDIRICTLKKPLEDLVSEPQCPMYSSAKTAIPHEHNRRR